MTETTRWQRAALAVAAVALIAACAGVPAQPGSPPPNGGASGTEPTIDPAAFPTFNAEWIHAHPELEQAIPVDALPVALETYSLPASAEPAAAGSDALADALGQMGRDPADLQLAVAVPADPESDELVVLAYGVSGLSGADLLAIVADDPVEGGSPGELMQRPVLIFTEDGDTLAYAYASRDVLFIVAGTHDAAVDTLTELPAP